MVGFFSHAGYVITDGYSGNLLGVIVLGYSNIINVYGISDITCRVREAGDTNVDRKEPNI